MAACRQCISVFYLLLRQCIGFCCRVFRTKTGVFETRFFALLWLPWLAAARVAATKTLSAACALSAPIRNFAIVRRAVRQARPRRGTVLSAGTRPTSQPHGCYYPSLRRGGAHGVNRTASVARLRHKRGRALRTLKEIFITGSARPTRLLGRPCRQRRQDFTGHSRHSCGGAVCTEERE